MEDNISNSGQSDQASLNKLVRYFDESEQLTSDARQLSERDRDYYDGEQWSAQEIAALKKRKQAPTVVNYIKRKVDFLRGFERRLRSDPKAYPRTPDDNDGAEAATDALRYVIDNNDFDRARSDVYENMVVEGYGGVDVVVEDVNGEKEIKIEHVAWDRIFFDPHSNQKDFSDAKYKGFVVWKDATDLLEEYPKAQAIIDATFADYTQSETHDDKPRNNWCDNQRKRVRVVQIHYFEKGEWMIAKYTKGGFLEEPIKSPYVDCDGNSVSSMELRSSYIDRDNNRYGQIREAISLQDEINKRRSKALHLLSSRQTKYETGAVKDLEKARRELAKPDGMIEVTPGMMFDEMNTNDMASSQFQLLQQSTAEMQATGPNAALSGKDPRQQSGKAIQAQQEGGSIEMEPMVDELNSWARGVYIAVWARVKQYWTEEKWVRITDDDKNIKWVGLNQKVTLQQQLEGMEEQERSQAMQQLQLQPNDPRLQEVVETKNETAKLNVDIVIEESPDISSLQSEQFELLGKLAQSGAVNKEGKPIPLEVIIQASSLRNKDKLIDMISGKDEEGEEQEVSPEVQQLTQRLQMAEQAMQEAEQEAQQLIAEKETAEDKSELEGAKIELEKAKVALEFAKLEADKIKVDREQVQEYLSDPSSISGNEGAVKDFLAEVEAGLAMKEMSKVISIQSASGDTYVGRREGNQIQIEMPSGEIMSGTVQ